MRTRLRLQTNIREIPVSHIDLDVLDDPLPYQVHSVMARRNSIDVKASIALNIYHAERCHIRPILEINTVSL